MDRTNRPQFHFLILKGNKIGQSLGGDCKNRGHVSQQEWHDKDPSLLLQDLERRPKCCRLHRQFGELFELVVSNNIQALSRRVTGSKQRTARLCLEITSTIKIVSFVTTVTSVHKFLKIFHSEHSYRSTIIQYLIREMLRNS